MKLSHKQREALEWLSVKPWEAAWWSGKPHTGWPKELPAATYNKLRDLGLIKTMHGSWSEKTTAITEAGRAAIAAHQRAMTDE